MLQSMQLQRVGHDMAAEQQKYDCTLERILEIRWLVRSYDGLYICCGSFFMLARIGFTASTSKVEKDQTAYAVQVLALPFINLLLWSNFSPHPLFGQILLYSAKPEFFSGV